VTTRLFHLREERIKLRERELSSHDAAWRRVMTMSSEQTAPRPTGGRNVAAPPPDEQASAASSPHDARRPSSSRGAEASESADIM
jgi:hypothetical protein